MYGDTDVMRRRADALREQAVDIRATADQLVAHLEAIGWSGRAADSMRIRVTERATHLREVAAQHETAAEALDKHLLEVETVTDEIAEIERRATDLVAEARTRVARVEKLNADAAEEGTGVRTEPEPDDVVLAAFDPPPSGHRDWLAVELPGL